MDDKERIYKQCVIRFYVVQCAIVLLHTACVCMCDTQWNPRFVNQKVFESPEEEKNWNKNLGHTVALALFTRGFVCLEFIRKQIFAFSDVWLSKNMTTCSIRRFFLLPLFFGESTEQNKQNEQKCPSEKFSVLFTISITLKIKFQFFSSFVWAKVLVSKSHSSKKEIINNNFSELCICYKITLHCFTPVGPHTNRRVH